MEQKQQQMEPPQIDRSPKPPVRIEIQPPPEVPRVLCPNCAAELSALEDYRCPECHDGGLEDCP